MIKHVPQGGELVTKRNSENKDNPFHKTMKNYKRYVIEDALKKSSGNQSKAARLLGLQRTYLARLIRQLNIYSKD